MNNKLIYIYVLLTTIASVPCWTEAIVAKDIVDLDKLQLGQEIDIVCTAMTNMESGTPTGTGIWVDNSSNFYFNTERVIGYSVQWRVIKANNNSFCYYAFLQKSCKYKEILYDSPIRSLTIRPITGDDDYLVASNRGTILSIHNDSVQILYRNDDVNIYDIKIINKENIVAVGAIQENYSKDREDHNTDEQIIAKPRHGIIIEIHPDNTVAEVIDVESAIDIFEINSEILVTGTEYSIYFKNKDKWAKRNDKILAKYRKKDKCEKSYEVNKAEGQRVCAMDSAEGIGSIALISAGSMNKCKTFIMNEDKASIYKKNICGRMRRGKGGLYMLLRNGTNNMIKIQYRHGKLVIKKLFGSILAQDFLVSPSGDIWADVDGVGLKLLGSEQ